MADKPTVLLASDSIAFVTYLAILLNRMGFEVLPAENGREVLHVLKLIRSDIVIFEANIENVSALSSIKEDPDLAKIPVIMVAENFGRKLYDECVELGCSAFLTKPIAVNELHSVIQKNFSYRSGKQRKFLRASFKRKVKVAFGGETREILAVNLSERGIYLSGKYDIPVDTEVEILLPIWERELAFMGKVIYRKGVYGDFFKIVPGIAVKFEDLTEGKAELLKDFVAELLVSDIIEEQEEDIITLMRKEAKEK
jgi:CheY-like chemotaxis protein